MSVEGKVVIVTGAARGIGQEYVRALAAAGAHPVAADLNDCADTIDLAKAAGGQALGVKCNITDAASTDAMVRAATDAFGRVYVTDASTHTLQRWDDHGRWLDETGTLGSEDTRFRRPSGVARLGSLGVVVLDLQNRRLTAYDLQLRLLGVLVRFDDEALEARTGHVTPVSVSADRGGALAVADADADRVLLFDFAGRFTKEVGGIGGRAGTFRDVVAMAMAPTGTLVVVEERPAPRRRKGAAADTAAARSALAS